MLKQQITEFIAQCKVVDFAPKSIQSLTASLRELKTFLDEQGIAESRDITYRHISGFVADFNQPSVHKKKARVWCLHQFFHFLITHKKVRENIAIALNIEHLNLEAGLARISEKGRHERLIVLPDLLSKLLGNESRRIS